MVVEATSDADERREEASGQQRSLFSWAEFMAAGAEQPKRRRRDEAPTLSLFEWTLEREREVELAGAIA